MKTTIIVTMLFLALACNKKEGRDDYVAVSLQVLWQIGPVKDTINLGDTLALAANFSDTIYEVKFGQHHYLPNFFFNNVMSIMQIGDTSKYDIDQTPGMAAFQYTSRVGEINNISTRFGRVRFDSTGPGYKCNILLKALRRGTFTIFLYYSPSPNASTKIPEISFGTNESGGRRIGEMSLARYAINDGNTNPDLFIKNCKPTTDPYSSPWHYRFLFYTFVVR